MAKILVVNGPNLNLLGRREAQHYGTATLAEIEHRLLRTAEQAGIAIEFFQSNHEGEIVDFIQGATQKKIDCLIVNAAAYTHYSIAIYDALKAVEIPFIEVHLSNIYAREEFRHHSLLSPLAAGGIFGFGEMSYDLALQAAIETIKREAKKKSILC